MNNEKCLRAEKGDANKECGVYAFPSNIFPILEWRGLDFLCSASAGLVPWGNY